MISGPKARLTNRDIRCPDMPGIRLPTVEGGPRFRGIAPRQPGERCDSLLNDFSNLISKNIHFSPRWRSD